MMSAVTVASILGLIATTTLAANCPSGFTEVKGVGCYLFSSNTSLTWPEAHQYCRDMGAYLAEVTTEEEEFNLMTMALERPGDYWIGLTDLLEEGSFIWNNSGSSTNLTAWAGNQPNGGILENCVAMRERNAFFWADEDCQLRHDAICESAFLLNVCGTGWDYLTVTNSCYLINSPDLSSRSWSAAVQFCRDRDDGSFLTEITSQEEHDAIIEVVLADNNVPSNGYWIGLSDEAEEGTYKWETSGEVATFFNWGDGQPDSGTAGNCVALYEYGAMKWYDTYCGESFAFYPLCERVYDGRRIDEY